MTSREQFESAQQAREYLSRAGIIITPDHKACPPKGGENTYNARRRS